MKKFVLVLVIFLSTDIFAYQARSKLLTKLLTDILHKEDITVYSNDTKLKLKTIKDCKAAEAFVVDSISEFPTYCQDVKNIIFLTNYKEYKKTKNAIGVLFWQKGRPNLILNEKKIKELSIELPKEFDPYVE